jgi:mRNA degradation ribonuclease J1/J2
LQFKTLPKKQLNHKIKLNRNLNSKNQHNFFNNYKKYNNQLFHSCNKLKHNEVKQLKQMHRKQYSKIINYQLNKKPAITVMIN